MAKLETKGRHLEVLRTSLENTRSKILPHWTTLANFILPRRLQLSPDETNQKDLRNTDIINNTATLASRTLSSGMMAGITSPSRPWFRLTLPDASLSEEGPVKEWLHLVAELMGSIFLQSNLYNALPILYADLGVFGTASMLAEEDFEDVLRFQTLPVGSYSLALNDKLEVDVFFREFRLTVRQVVERFAIVGKDGKPNMSKFSQGVRDNYKNDHLDNWVDVRHVIQRNKEHDPRNLTSKLYQSIYYEKGADSSVPHSTAPEKFLRESGYDFFPVLSPRWKVTGEDVYGQDCPGMTALGDIKALQVLEKRKGQAIDKMVNPPLMGPGSLRQSAVSILPGDMNYIDITSGQQGLGPVFQVNFDTAAVSAEIREHELRIRRAFYEDLFLMLATSDRRQITATEIDERKEEKLLALGPVLEQLNQDLLDPLIDIAFDVMTRQGLIPEPPEELQGTTLKVEYISIMHAAQKLSGLAGIERLTQFIGETAALQPDVLDKMDFDELIDEYSKIIGAPPKLIRTDEMVAEIRVKRAEAEAAAQQAEQLKATAGAAKDLASADLDGNNALAASLKQAEAGALQ